MNKVIAVFLLLFVSGCATPVKTQFVDLSEREICCNSIAEFNYKQLTIGKSTKIELSEESPLYEFAEQKSYFEAFSLPETEGHYFFIKSYFNGVLIGQYLDPIFIVLNNNYEPIEAFSLDLAFKEGEFFGDPNAHMESVFKLNKGSKYLIIFAGNFDKTSQAAELPSSTSAMMIGNIPIVTHNPGHTKQLERSPTGTLKIEILPLK